VAVSLGVVLDSWDYTRGKYTASYKDEHGDNVYFYVPVDDAYNLALIRQEIQSCLDKNIRIKEAEAKKAGLTLIEEENKLPRVKGTFFLMNYGGKKGANNPYINYIADDPNGFKYLKVVAKPVIKKKF